MDLVVLLLAGDIAIGKGLLQVGQSLLMFCLQLLLGLVPVSNLFQALLVALDLVFAGLQGLGVPVPYPANGSPPAAAISF